MKEIYKTIDFDKSARESLVSYGEKITQSLVLKLKDKGLTLSTAESCTGGLIGAMITGVSGASQVYVGGVVSYTNEVKINILGVPKQVIEEHTEVSRETAQQMSLCVRKKFGTNIGVSVTGFAGPTGGNEHDPMGTVYIGVDMNGESHVWRVFFGDNPTRNDVRVASAYFALAVAERMI